MADENVNPDPGDAEIAGVVIRRPERAAAPPAPTAPLDPTALSERATPGPPKPVPPTPKPVRAPAADDRIKTAAAAAPEVPFDLLVGETVIGDAAGEPVSTSRRRRVTVPRVVAVAATAAALLGVGGALGMSPDADRGDPVTVAAAPPVTPSQTEPSTAQPSPSAADDGRETDQAVSRDSTRVAPRTSDQAGTSRTSNAPARPSTAAAPSSSAATSPATSATSASGSPSGSPSETPSEGASRTPSESPTESPTPSPTEKSDKGKSPSPTPSASPTDDGDSDDDRCLLGICW